MIKEAVIRMLRDAIGDVQNNSHKEVENLSITIVRGELIQDKSTLEMK
jgi:hypothetical protein